jgi:hypothetical protein
MPVSRGEKDPGQRLDHWNNSVSMDKFIQHAKSKTLETLRFEAGKVPIKLGPITVLEGEGPKGHKYVKDPLDPPRNSQPGGVIDMKHFIAAATTPLSLGEYTGAVVEHDQQRRNFPSGHFEEDYKSNFLGVVFRNNYWKNDKDVSGEFRQFFQDYQKGQLKGFWPAMDKATAELGRKGAAGIKKLEQLTDFATDYATRMGQQGIQHLKNLKNSLEQMLKVNPINELRKLIDNLSSAEQTLMAQQGIPQPDSTPFQTMQRDGYVTSHTLSIDPTLQAEYQRHAQMIVSAVGDQSQILDEVLDVGIAAYAIGERWNDYSLAENVAYARMVLESGSSVVQSAVSSADIEQYLSETVQEAVTMAENSLVEEQQTQQVMNQMEYDA